MTRDEVWQHRQFRKFRFLHTELRPGDSAGYILPDIAQHTLEKSEGFLLIFIDRRLLRIGPQVNDLPKGVQRRQDRKSTRLNSVTNAHLVCLILLEKKKKI